MRAFAVVFGIFLTQNVIANTEPFTAMTCESDEVFPVNSVPVISIVAPKVLSNEIPVLLFTARKTLSDIPTKFECRIARITHRGSEQMNISCVGGKNNSERLSIHSSRTTSGWVANIRHKGTNSEVHELDGLNCKPYTTRVTRPY